MLYFLFCLLGTTSTEIYTLSLHDALPISGDRTFPKLAFGAGNFLLVSEAFRTNSTRVAAGLMNGEAPRSEEHTSELQSRQYLVCRLLLEKKKQPTRTESSIERRGMHGYKE